MKPRLFSLIVVTIVLLQANKLTAQDNEFSRGFQEGFKKGYCYNKNFLCNPPLAPMTPLPRINESDNSYTDGYNRGFQVGLDLQRLDGSFSSTTNFNTISDYRFNDYIPTIPINAYANVLAYKQALFNKRVDWLQKRINDLHDLNYILIYSMSQEYYGKIREEILNTSTVVKGNGDFTDDKIFIPILNQTQTQIYNTYSQLKEERNVKKINETYLNLIDEAFKYLDDDPEKSLGLLSEIDNSNVEKTMTFFFCKASALFNLSKCKEGEKNLDAFKKLYDNTKEKEEFQRPLNLLILRHCNCLLFDKQFVQLINILNSYFGEEFNNPEYNKEIYATKIVAYTAIENFNKGLEYCDKYINLNKGRGSEGLWRIYQQKAINLRELGRFEDALQTINSAIKEATGEQIGEFYGTRGKIYFKMKKYTLGIDDFLRALAKDPEDGEVCYYLGKSYFYLNQKSKACTYLQKAIKYDNKEALEDYPIICK